MDYQFSNPDVQRQFEANVSTEHFYLTPFRWLKNVYKGVLWVVGVTIICSSYATWTYGGWIFGHGGLGQGDRNDRVARLEAAAQDSHDGYSDNVRETTIDFNAPHEGMTNGLLTYCGEDIPVQDFDKGPFFTNWDTDLYLSRSTRSFYRKSARMFIGYANGMFMNSALNYTLSQIKRHPDRDVNVEGLCDLGRDERTSAIKITGAPVVRIRIMNTDNYLPPSEDSKGFHITGLCLVQPDANNPQVRQPGDCSDGDDDLIYGTTLYADLFATVPPLKPDQVVTLAAIETMSTDAFWLNTAHANGIYGHDIVVKALADRARHAALNNPYGPASSDADQLPSLFD